MSHGIQTSQDEHVVNILPPVSQNGATTSQAVSMAGFGHVSIVLQFGVSTAQGAVTLQAGTATAAIGANVAGAAAVPFDVYKQETAGAANNVLGARTPVPSAGFTPAAVSSVFYVLEFDADNLPAGSSYLQLVLAAATNALVSAVAILSGARFAGDQSLTATA